MKLRIGFPIDTVDSLDWAYAEVTAHDRRDSSIEFWREDGMVRQLSFQPSELSGAYQALRAMAKRARYNSAHFGLKTSAPLQDPKIWDDQSDSAACALAMGLGAQQPDPGSRTILISCRCDFAQSDGLHGLPLLSLSGECATPEERKAAGKSLARKWHAVEAGNGEILGMVLHESDWELLQAERLQAEQDDIQDLKVSARDRLDLDKLGDAPKLLRFVGRTVAELARALGLDPLPFVVREQALHPFRRPAAQARNMARQLLPSAEDYAAGRVEIAREARERILRALHDSGGVWLEGLPGSGKTVLALALAFEHEQGASGAGIAVYLDLAEQPLDLARIEERVLGFTRAVLVVADNVHQNPSAFSQLLPEDRQFQVLAVRRPTRQSAASDWPTVQIHADHAAFAAVHRLATGEHREPQVVDAWCARFSGDLTAFRVAVERHPADPTIEDAWDYFRESYLQRVADDPEEYERLLALCALQEREIQALPLALFPRPPDAPVLVSLCEAGLVSRGKRDFIKLAEPKFARTILDASRSPPDDQARADLRLACAQRCPQLLYSLLIAADAAHDLPTVRDAVERQATVASIVEAALGAADLMSLHRAATTFDLPRLGEKVRERLRVCPAPKAYREIAQILESGVRLQDHAPELAERICNLLRDSPEVLGGLVSGRDALFVLRFCYVQDRALAAKIAQKLVAGELLAWQPPAQRLCALRHAWTIREFLNWLHNCDAASGEALVRGLSREHCQELLAVGLENLQELAGICEFLAGNPAWATALRQAVAERPAALLVKPRVVHLLRKLRRPEYAPTEKVLLDALSESASQAPLEQIFPQATPGDLRWLAAAMWPRDRVLAERLSSLADEQAAEEGRGGELPSQRRPSLHRAVVRRRTAQQFALLSLLDPRAQPTNAQDQHLAIRGAMENYLARLAHDEDCRGRLLGLIRVIPFGEAVDLLRRIQPGDEAAKSLRREFIQLMGEQYPGDLLLSEPVDRVLVFLGLIGDELDCTDWIKGLLAKPEQFVRSSRNMDILAGVGRFVRKARGYQGIDAFIRAFIKGPPPYDFGKSTARSIAWFLWNAALAMGGVELGKAIDGGLRERAMDLIPASRVGHPRDKFLEIVEVFGAYSLTQPAQSPLLRKGDPEYTVMSALRELTRKEEVEWNYYAQPAPAMRLALGLRALGHRGEGFGAIETEWLRACTQGVKDYETALKPLPFGCEMIARGKRALAELAEGGGGSPSNPTPRRAPPKGRRKRIS